MPRRNAIAHPPGAEAAASRQRARVFWSGRSQAVRLPKAFRFSTNEVTIHRAGNAIVLQPLEVPRDENGWPQAWWKLAGADPEFDLGARPRDHERRDIFERPLKTKP
jgi:antitoxin VapB